MHYANYVPVLKTVIYTTAVILIIYGTMRLIQIIKNRRDNGSEKNLKNMRKEITHEKWNNHAVTNSRVCDNMRTWWYHRRKHHQKNFRSKQQKRVLKTP